MGLPEDHRRWDLRGLWDQGQAQREGGHLWSEEGPWGWWTGQRPRPKGGLV